VRASALPVVEAEEAQMGRQPAGRRRAQDAAEGARRRPTWLCRRREWGQVGTGAGSRRREKHGIAPPCRGRRLGTGVCQGWAGLWAAGRMLIASFLKSQNTTTELHD
jgi:hypothetical protein